MKRIAVLPFLLFSFALMAQPTTEGLICWLPFDGHANDLSPFGHVGEVHGALLDTDRHGTPNNAYFFDGENDYIFFPDHPSLRLGNTSFTISTWIRPDEISDSQSHTVISKRTGSGNQGYLFQLIGTAHIMGLAEGAFDIVTSGGWDDPKITTSAQLSTQAWHHVLYCYDATTKFGQFFIDNIPDVIGQMIDANGDANGGFYIGKDKLTDGNEYPSIEPGYIGGFYFNGAIDDIRIYNRKLERQEREALFYEAMNPTTQTNQEISIKIYPDPVSRHLEVSAFNAQIRWFKVHDSTGRLYLESIFVEKIDCSSLPSGSFLISFFDIKKRLIKTEKFIKQ